MAEETITAQTPEIDPGMSVVPEAPGLMDVPTVIPELGLAAQALASQVSFAKKTWKDGSGGGTPVTAAELNRLEQGVADLTAAVNGLRDSVSRVRVEGNCTSTIISSWASGNELWFVTKSGDKVFLAIPSEKSGQVQVVKETKEGVREVLRTI